MNINKAFESNWLKADELEAGDMSLTVKHIALEKVGDENKPVLYFLECTRGLVLNKTNATTLAGGLGHETDAWAGKKITLYRAMVEYAGKMMPGIRVRLGASAPNGSQKPAPSRPPAPPRGPAAPTLRKFWVDQGEGNQPVLTDEHDIQSYIVAHKLDPRTYMLCQEGSEDWKPAESWGFKDKLPF